MQTAPAEEAAKLEEDWLLDHPKLYLLNSYVNGSRPQLLSVLQTYLDLTEVKLWYRVDIGYSEEIKMAFLRAQQSKDSNVMKCILPLTASFTLTMERLSEFFSALKDHIPCCHGDQGLPQLTISLVDSDSSIVYYHMTDGLEVFDGEENMKS